MHREQLGGLNCILTDVVGDAPPEAVAVFCHGFGAPGTDLVPLAGALADRLGEVADRVQFVFPAAPLSLDSAGIPGGRAWWPIDMLQLQMAMATGDFRDLRTETPELLPEMSARLTSLMAEILALTNLPVSRLIVGGFSQGAMLATDAALRLEERPGGLVVWSGTLLSESAWSEAAARGSRLRVVQSHAVDDPILPYSGAEGLRDLLSVHGHAVEFLRFRGGHTIPESAIRGRGG
jgi:phospholipase/carboxylesterase